MLEPAEAVQVFAKASDISTFAAGDVIFEANATGDVMYGVMEGTIELTLNGKVLETIEHGDVFGEGALVQIPPTRATTAIAKTDCKLALIDRNHFMFMVQETPLFALEVIRSLSTRLRALKAEM